jgi:hypothetical protein
LNLFDAPDMGEGLFIGREAELQEMEKILQVDSEFSGSTRKILVLGGMGGIGKTQLAISFAKRHRSSYSSIFWLNATSEAALRTSFRSVANRLLPLEAIKKLDEEQIYIHVANWFSEQENTRWLLIFDNHDGPDQYDITKYYPSVAHGSTITTTRMPHDLRGEHIKLKSMIEEEDGLRILATRSGRQDIWSGETLTPLSCYTLIIGQIQVHISWLAGWTAFP